MGDLTRQYLAELGRYPLLTHVEEVELAKAIEAGSRVEAQLSKPSKRLSPVRRAELQKQAEAGRAAKRRFIQSNLRLVVAIAKKYSASGLPLLDLIQEGNVGLIRGVEKYDYRRGFKFSTYATWWIRQAVTRAIADKGRTVRLPVHLGESLYRLKRVRSELFEQLRREPTIEELAGASEMTPAKLLEVVRVAEPVSIHEPVGDEGAELGDFIADPAPGPFEAAALTLRRQGVWEMLESLTERERKVIALRFGLPSGEPYTLKEVGRAFGLTQERIRQIESKALCKLRHPTNPAKVRDMVTI